MTVRSKLSVAVINRHSSSELARLAYAACAMAFAFLVVACDTSSQTPGSTGASSTLPSAEVQAEGGLSDAPGAPEPQGYVRPTEWVPEGPEVFFRHTARGTNAGTVTMTASTCALDPAEGAIVADQIKIHFINDTGSNAAFYIGRFEGGHSYTELEAFVTESIGAGSTKAMRPDYLAFQGSTLAEGWYVNHGGYLGSRPFALEPGWIGWWSGPRTEAITSDTFAVVCYRQSRRSGRLTPVGVVGPIEVRGSRVETSGNVDATITLAGSRCELDGADGPIPPGTLRLEFVNDSHLEGLFKVVRLAGDQRLGELRAHPGPAYIGGNTFIDPASTGTWSRRRIASGRWAVICWKDLIAAPNGFQISLADVAGPIEVG